MPIVTLITDFGRQDAFVGCLHGVILTRCPQATIVDVTHEIRPYDICGASYVLESIRPCFGPGTIHVAIVDPGVGGARRGLLADIDGQFFIAPDNGVMTLLLRGATRSAVRHLTAQEFWRHPVSRSFHGRDIFAPVAGHLAAGVSPERFGPLVSDPVLLPVANKEQDDGQVRGEIIWIDRFGNCITSIPGEGAAAQSVCHAGRSLSLVDHFGAVPPGEPAALIGSSGRIELFINQGDFAAKHAARINDPVTLQAGGTRTGAGDG